MGSGDFAVPTVQGLLDSKHDVVAVVAPPPRKSGRGRKVHATPTADLARSAGVDVLETDNVNNDAGLAFVADHRPDVIVVVEFGQFLRRGVRELARLDCINLHGSVLPALRGAAPVNWAIIRGYSRTGLTTFSLVDRMDAGPVYRTTTVAIPPDERAGELRERLAALGPGLVEDTLAAIAAGAEPTSQDDTAATYAPILKKTDGHLDFRRPAAEIANRAHGTYPWPGGKAVFRPRDGKLVEVTLTHVCVAEDCGLPPGEVGAEFLVGTGKGSLEILELQPAGKKPMDFKAFANGYRVAAGDQFIGVAQ